MPYPLTGSTQTATGVTVPAVQAAVPVAVTRAWGYATFPGYTRNVSVLIAQGAAAGGSGGGTSTPPTSGQLWPRGGRTSAG